MKSSKYCRVINGVTGTTSPQTATADPEKAAISVVAKKAFLAVTTQT
jgi:hypothetical protein